MSSHHVQPLHSPTSSFSKVVEQVSPAIVSIYTKVTIEANPAEIFGPFMFHEPKKIEREALGSGIILTRRGLIVTNDHVVEKADKIKVVTSDEQQYDAEVVIRDGLHDIAILRIISEDDDDDDDEEEENQEDEFDDEDENEEDNTQSKNQKTNYFSVKSLLNKLNFQENNNSIKSIKTKKKSESKSKNDLRSNTIINLEEEIDREPRNSYNRSFPYLTMGSAELCKVGDYVLAIGNNLGFHGTVTDGIISAIGRTNDERLPIAYPQFPLIQTNASINPGSSGGALVNMKGELIGVNESIATSTGGNVGVGFAVPSNFIRPLLRSAMKKSFQYEMERVWDGITPVSCPIAILSKEEAKEENEILKENNNNLEELRITSHQQRAYPRGIRVKSIHKKSPAAIAGIKKNDIILSINSINIDNINTYYLLIAGADPSKTFKYHIIRENKSNSIIQRSKSKSQTRSQSRSRSHSRTNENEGFGSRYRKRRIFAEEDKNNNRGRQRSRSMSSDKKDLLNRSWYDFGINNCEKIDLMVRIELIPLPDKKPLEIKDRLNPFYGSSIVELCPAINSDFALDFSQQGVAIWDIEHGSQAYKLGFRIGDIIISIDNQRLKTLEDVENIGDRLQTRKNCRIKFKRSGKINHVDVYLRTRRRYFSRL